jgi:hypothetical protein
MLLSVRGSINRETVGQRIVCELSSNIWRYFLSRYRPKNCLEWLIVLYTPHHSLQPSWLGLPNKGFSAMVLSELKVLALAHH